MWGLRLINPKFIHLLVRDGAPIEKKEDRWSNDWDCIDYYSGSRFNTSYKQALLVYDDLLKNGIDYEKCRDWIDGTEYGFAGTDDDPIINDVLSCIVVSNSGAEFKFAAHVPTRHMSAMTFVMKIIEMEISAENALAGLHGKIQDCQRNGKKYGGNYFKYEDFIIGLETNRHPNG